MKTMTVFEAKNHFSRALRVAEEDVVVITRRGKPVATIQSITERDLEDGAGKPRLPAGTAGDLEELSAPHRSAQDEGSR